MILNALFKIVSGCPRQGKRNVFPAITLLVTRWQHCSDHSLFFLAFSTLYLFIYITAVNNKTAMQMKYLVAVATLAQNSCICVADYDSCLSAHHNTRRLFRKCVKFHPIFKWNWCRGIAKQRIIDIFWALLLEVNEGEKGVLACQGN